jgi:hypothetical protein
MSDQV